MSLTSSRIRHLTIAAVLFGVLVLIALFVRDRWIRPHGGDLLVVIWLYHTIRGLTSLGRRATALIVAIVSLGLEAAQAFQLVEVLGLTGNRVAEVVIGTTADPIDAVMYLVGIAIAVLTDANRAQV